MRHIFSCLLFLFMTATISPASVYAQTDDASQQDTARMLDRIDRLERDLAQVQGQVYRNDGSSPSASSDAPSSGGGNSGNLEVRISQLEEQMRSLNGKVEKAQNDVTVLTEKMNKMAADNDFRLNEIEKKLAPGAGVAGTAPDANAQPGGVKPVVLQNGKNPISKSIPGDTDDEVTVDNTNPSHSLGTLPVGQLPKKPLVVATKDTTGSDDAADDSASGDDEKENKVQSQYDHAYALLRQQKYPEAEKSLKKFITDNGTNPLAGNAYYLLGEDYYTQHIYDKAAIQYLKGYKQFPKGSKAPDSLLKLAISLGNLKRTKDACSLLAKFNKAYPNAAGHLADKATEESTKFGCAG